MQPISAGIRRDSPLAALVMDWALEGLLQPVTCPLVVAEYLDVFFRPKFRQYGFPPFWVQFLLHESLQLPAPPPSPLPCPDPADAVFLALAEKSDAWLISGNLRHFPNRARGGVEVVSPAAYLDRLRAGA